MSLSVAVLFALLGCCLASGKDEACQSTTMCDDPGLFCTGSRCKCLQDIGTPDSVAKIWACNDVSDCAKINGIAVTGLASINRQPSRAPVCVPSKVCPAITGFTGYCDVEMVA